MRSSYGGEGETCEGKIWWEAVLMVFVVFLFCFGETRDGEHTSLLSKVTFNGVPS